jgi:virginiamycin B lyase
MAITNGPDGNLWFNEPFFKKIGKISPVSGVIIEYNVSGYLYNLDGITAGPDGNIWFTEEEYGGRLGIIGKISPATGVLTEYSVPTNYAPNSIAVGPDGNLWFNISGEYKIGNINPSTGIIAEYLVDN